MALTAIFATTDTAPTAQLDALTDRLLKAHNPTPQGGWQLDARTLRSTDAGDDAKRPQPRQLDMVALSQHGARAFVAVDGRGAGGAVAEAVVAVPAGQRDALRALVERKMAALWVPRARLAVQQGAVYETGEFVVRVGELRQVGGAQNAVRVVVACVQCGGEGIGAGAAEEDVQRKKEAIRTFWKSFGVESAKEYFYIPTADDDGFGEIRLWCEVLRLRL